MRSILLYRPKNLSTAERYLLAALIKCNQQIVKAQDRLSSTTPRHHGGGGTGNVISLWPGVDSDVFRLDANDAILFSHIAILLPYYSLAARSWSIAPQHSVDLPLQLATGKHSHLESTRLDLTSGYSDILYIGYLGDVCSILIESAPRPSMHLIAFSFALCVYMMFVGSTSCSRVSPSSPKFA